MVKHTQKIRRLLADELFDHFVGLAFKGLNNTSNRKKSAENTDLLVLASGSISFVSVVSEAVLKM